MGPFIHRINPVIWEFGGIYLWWYGLSYSRDNLLASGYPGAVIPDFKLTSQFAGIIHLSLVTLSLAF